MSKGLTRWVWFVYAVAIAVAAAAMSSIPWWTVDDAFISYRYGYNLYAHGELTWNVHSGQMVEGYTGILLPVLATTILALGLPLLGTIKVLGIGAMLGTGLIVAQSLRRLGVEPLGRSLAMLVLAAMPLTYLHAISGLETTFFTLLITGAILSLAGVDFQSMTLARSGLSAIYVLLAGFCRPEGIALAALLVVWLLISAIKHGFQRTVLRHCLTIGSASILLAVYWFWRMDYYDSFFPNSYYAKAYHGIINWESVLALGKFAGYYCTFPFAALLVIRFMAPKGDGQHHLHPTFWISIGFIALCAATYLHANLWMNYGSRFFYPFFPLFVTGICLGITSRMKELRDCDLFTAPKKRILRNVLIAIFLLQVGVWGFRFKQEWQFLNYYDAIVHEELIPVGKYLAANLPEDAVVISYMDAGAVGYYSRLKIVDFGRLSNPYLAQSNPSLVEAANYFFAANADAVVLTSQLADAQMYIDEANAIVSDPRFDRYEWKQTWGNSAGYPYWQRLYLRRK